MLGKIFTLRGGDAPLNTVGLRMLGFPIHRHWPLGSTCRAYVDLASAYVTAGFTSTAKSWSVPVRMPNDRSFVGITTAWQTWYLPPQSPTRWSLTNGVLTTFGAH